MVRQRASLKRTSGGRTMSQREAQLHSMGVVLGGAAGQIMNTTVGDFLADSTFSGYGAYRPITVRSYSMPENADLERDQQGN